MLAFIPIIGPACSIVTVASWEIIKLLFTVSGTPLSTIVGTSVLPWIGLGVWALAF